MKNHRSFARMNGRSSPNKPVTPEQIAAFAQMWKDPGLTIDMIGRRYGIHGRTAQKWARAFGLPPRDELPGLQAKGTTVDDVADQIVQDTRGVARIVTETAKARAEGITTGGADAVQWDPLSDPEIKLLLDDIKNDAQKVTACSDLTALNRRMLQFSVLIAMKMPVYTWQTLQTTVEVLSRSLLSARRIEAGLPPPEADQALLRKEIAAQLLRELKSALSPQDQARLAEVMKRGVDVLLARQNGRAAAPDGHLGSTLPQHNGKAQPRSSPPYPSA